MVRLITRFGIRKGLSANLHGLLQALLSSAPEGMALFAGCLKCILTAVVVAGHRQFPPPSALPVAGQGVLSVFGLHALQFCDGAVCIVLGII